jgi:hypothetical protein
VSGDDQGLAAVDDRSELGLPRLELLHQPLVVVADLLQSIMRISIVSDLFNDKTKLSSD